MIVNLTKSPNATRSRPLLCVHVMRWHDTSPPQCCGYSRTPGHQRSYSIGTGNGSWICLIHFIISTSSTAVVCHHRHVIQLLAGRLSAAGAGVAKCIQTNVKKSTKSLLYTFFHVLISFLVKIMLPICDGCSNF